MTINSLQFAIQEIKRIKIYKDFKKMTLRDKEIS